MSQGSYVTEERIGKIDDELRDNEMVQYIAKGNSLDAKYQGSTTNYNNTKGWPRLVATDKRVFFKVPKVLNTKVESVEYNELSGADLGSSGLSGTEIKLRTIQGKTFVFKADEPGDVELEELVDFIREQITDQPEAEPQTTSTTSTNIGSSSDRAELHKTESCVECGESVSEGVSRCPNCGFNPGEHKKWFYIHALLAGISGATLVGLVIVPFFVWKGQKHRKKYKQGVTG